MKQVVIINNDLKMSKGKIARVCFGLGHSLHNPGIIDKIKWRYTGGRAVVLKSNMIDVDVEILKRHKIKFVEHIDAGKTQVPEGSLCGVAFWLSDNKDLFKACKLL